MKTRVIYTKQDTGSLLIPGLKTLNLRKQSTQSQWLFA